MTRFILVGIILIVGIAMLMRSRSALKTASPTAEKPKPKIKSKPEKWSWIQVYDTDSFEEAKQIIARLEEEEIDCFLYEQGRKDAHGNPLKGFGVIVPRGSLSRAQTIISRLPV